MTDEVAEPVIVGEIHITVLEDDVIFNTSFEDPASIVYFTELFKTMFISGLIKSIVQKGESDG